MIVLIIGGTGTLGKNVLPLLFQNPQVERVRILSRGEHTQMQMAEEIPDYFKARTDFFVGDCRDRERVIHASKHCDLVFHFAAMKSVDKAEYDPWESVQTNIIGTKNVIEACIQNQVEKAVFTSTDKAVAPLNIYGASKLVAEKLFIQANIGRNRTRFSVMRYGNVFGSQGSVVAKWKTRIDSNKPLQITHEEMTRFFILPEMAAEFVVDRAYEAKGGEVFIPKMKSCTMINLARTFGESVGYKVDLANVEWLGIRPGEKMHEVLISQDEVDLTTDCGNFYIRWPNKNLFPVLKRGEPVKKGFTSYDAERFSKEELLELVECQLKSLPKSEAATWENGLIVKNPLTDVQISASTR